MIDVFVNLALNLRPKTFQKSTQEASKIDQKGIENMMHVGLKLRALLGRFWVDSWEANWNQVGIKCRKMSQKGSNNWSRRILSQGGVVEAY